MASDPSVPVLSGDPLMQEARKRFDRCVEWESQARERFLADYKFAYGDDANGFQWPNSIRRNRDVDQRPCLTMNLVRQHNLQVCNETKLSKSDVKIVGIGGGASADAARTFEALVRRISYRSASQDAYATAQEFQVAAGIGWWRIITDYSDNETFDQEIYIRRVIDPLSVYIDPDAQEKDKRDARFAFVFDLVPLDEFEDSYPEYASIASLQPMGVSSTDGDWLGKNYVRVCEYFRRVSVRDRLISFVNPDTKQKIQILASRLPDDVADSVIKEKGSAWRYVWRDEIRWHLIVGERFCDETLWPGSYIPLIPVIGEEIIVDGILDRKGHTRYMKDAQRMFNYNASSQVEFVALQGKTPWVAPVKAIEELENYWRTANTINHSVLPYNSVDDEGNEIPAPQRTEPPTVSAAYQTGMDTAFQQIMMVSGQWQAQMGMAGNERTGEAISQRQLQSDKATAHLQDNYAAALRYTGVQLIDLIPRVYDTARIVKIMAEDGSEIDLQIDPFAAQAYQEQIARDGAVLQRIFNPNVGNYEVQADVGPAYATRREDTADALTLILTQAPGLTGIIGDLLMQSFDFDKADEAARRLRRMVPPQALGQGPSPNEQQLMAQVQALQGQIGKLLERTSKDTLKLVGKDQMRDIDVYKAETDRMKALAPLLPENPEGLQQIIQQMVADAIQTNILPILQANSPSLQSQGGTLPPGANAPQNGNGSAASLGAPVNPPIPGSRQAPDGEWYLADPTRRGKYLRVAPLAQERTQRSVISNA